MSGGIPGIGTRVEFVGPLQHHDVIVDGWTVPLVTAGMASETEVMLICDERLAATFTVEEAERFVPFLADCISVALGYTCHPGPDDETRLAWEPPHPKPRRVHRIAEIQAGSPGETGA